MKIGDRAALQIREGGRVGEVETWTLCYPTAEGPDDALNPRSVVGAILLGLEGAGSQVTYDGPADNRGRRRTFELQVIAVWRAPEFLPELAGRSDAA